MQVDKDSFSSGQIGSKIWLCEKLEQLFDKIDNIVIYGGWYGITAFLLQSRNNIKIEKIVSLDKDPDCEPVADMINEHWKWQNWAFKSFTLDCNKDFTYCYSADLIINTSTEHFESLDWFNNIPAGKVLALQGADMIHDDHVFEFNDLDNFVKIFPLTEYYYVGEKEFVYPSWRFKRFMVIGIK